MKKQYNADENENLKDLQLKNIDAFYNFLENKVDKKFRHRFTYLFCLSFKNKSRIMIVAFDFQRDKGENEIESLNSVFSLHSKKNGRETIRNDYWKFIKPIIKNNFVYLTDIYKFYYLTSRIKERV